jgi:hypothetical protein
MTTVPSPVRMNTALVSESGSGITLSGSRSVIVGGSSTRTRGPWHSLNSFPEPHGQGSSGSIFANLRLPVDEHRQRRIYIATQIGYAELQALKHEQ